MFFSGDMLFSSFGSLFWEILISLGAHTELGVQPPGVDDEEAQVWPGEGLCQAVPNLVSISQGVLDTDSPTPAQSTFLHIVHGDSLKMMMVVSFLLVRAKQTIF